MSLNAYDLSAGLFIRGMTNLKTQLTKAENYATATGISETALLNAQLATDDIGSDAPADLHMYTLAAQVHWAAEGAKLAVTQLLGAPSVPTANDAKSFAEALLHNALHFDADYKKTHFNGGGPERD